MDYENVPGHIGAIISNKLATLNELDTIYSTEDVYDMIEIIAVDAFNSKILQKTNK